MSRVFEPMVPLKALGEVLLAYEIEERANEISPAFGKAAHAAIYMAAQAHAGQTRSNRGALPRDTYITHPLRNALRLLRYGVTDPEIIIAAIFHDTVEDAAVFLATEMYQAEVVDTLREDEAALRRMALECIEYMAGARVRHLVEAVTNPLGSTPTNKAARHEAYREHVRTSILEDDVAVVKLTDIIDNAIGLKHNTANAAMQKSLAGKYLPLIPDFIELLGRPGVQDILTPHGVQGAMVQLTEGLVKLDELANMEIA